MLGRACTTRRCAREPLLGELNYEAHEDTHLIKHTASTLHLEDKVPAPFSTFDLYTLKMEIKLEMKYYFSPFLQNVNTVQKSN
jgi:hypothetical protein